MYQNQRTILKGYILCFFGILISILSMSFMPIYANILNNPIGDIPIYILLIFVFIGIFMIISSSKFNIMLIHNFRLFIHPAIIVNDTKWFIQGVPNNPYKDFAIDLNQILDLKEIVFKEIEKGIYVLNVKEEILRFDMRGWIRKRYYIYEYFLTLIQLQNEKCIYKKHHINDTQTFKVLFIDKLGRKKEKILIKDYFTKLSFLFKYRTKIKFMINTLYKKKTNYSINEYYHFN